MVVVAKVEMANEPVLDLGRALAGYVAQLRLMERAAPSTRAGNGPRVRRIGPPVEYDAKVTRDRVRASMWARESVAAKSASDARWAAEGR